MSNRPPMTLLEKQQIYEAKLEGCTIAEIAKRFGCSIACARKWWRRGRDQGLNGLREARRGREKSGRLSQFDTLVAGKALELKQTYPKWGANRVLIEFADDEELQLLRLPAASTLAAYFKEACPHLLRKQRDKNSKPATPRQAGGVHEVWQLDHQEAVRLADGEVALICNVRDPYASAVIASRAFVVTTAQRWRKLTLQEVQFVLRQAFAEWQTMPQMILTDNELGLAGSPGVDFPDRLTLWLVGLGIGHQFIRPGRPTDQGAVERTHRTMDGFAVHQQALTNCATLQTSLDKERRIHNERFPSRAGTCAGNPPLVVHPQLLYQPRPYRLEHEFTLFNIQSVAKYLAAFTFERKVNSSGQISLGRIRYHVGQKYAGCHVIVRFNDDTHEWVFTDNQSGAHLGSKRPEQFSVEAFTGLQKPQSPPEKAIQLTFPGFVTSKKRRKKRAGNARSERILA